MRSAMAKQGSDKPGRGRRRRELETLAVREWHHTVRLGLCAVAAVLAVACLIPIANARPREQGRR
jgi:hypothetical protein